jgi:hypothetical protein
MSHYLQEFEDQGAEKGASDSEFPLIYPLYSHPPTPHDPCPNDNTVVNSAYRRQDGVEERGIVEVQTSVENAVTPYMDGHSRGAKAVFTENGVSGGAIKGESSDSGPGWYLALRTFTRWIRGV